MAKPRTFKTLDEKSFKWIEKTEKTKKESTPGRPSTNAERQRYLHIRRVAIKDRELLKDKRHRLLPICYELITLLNDSGFAGMLVEPIILNLMIKEGGPFSYMKAVYYRSCLAGVDEDRLFER